MHKKMDVLVEKMHLEYQKLTSAEIAALLGVPESAETERVARRHNKKVSKTLYLAKKMGI